MVIGIALLVCIIGGLVHVIAANGLPPMQPMAAEQATGGRVSELGRMAFAIDLFVALSGAGQAVALMVK